jgi:Amt family ammonium transporter
MRRVASIIPLLLSSLAFAEGQTPKLDKGDTAWMLTATALVILMSLPGLAIFYGGLAKAKDTLNTIAMVFTA